MFDKLLFLVLLLNVAFSSCEVLRNISCDFNDGHFCLYTLPDPVDAWQITHTSNEQRLITPRSPVTGSTGFADLIKDRGGLDSPQIRLRGQHCFSLDYYIIGTYLSQLSIVALPIDAAPVEHNFSRSGPQSFLLFVLNVYRSQTDAWSHYEATVDFREDVYRILIDGAAHQEYSTEFVAFDNVKFQEGPCQVGQTDVKKCNFEHVVNSAHPENLQCDWLAIENAPNSDPEHRARVTRSDQGLVAFHNSDHSTRTTHGGFIYVDGNQNPAQIQLPTFTPDMGRHCLTFATKQPTTYDSFYYQVIETELHSGRENVLLEYDDRNSNNTVGTSWIKQYVNINPVRSINVTLRVLGENLLLDTFQLVRGSCKNNIDCDFRQNACDWSLSDYWYVGRGRLRSVSENIDADYDHKYLYHDFRAREDGYARFIYSDAVSPGVYCFKYVFKRQHLTNVAITTVLGESPMPEYRTETDGEWEVKYVIINKTRWFRVLLEVRAKGFEGRNVRIFKLREVALSNGPCE